MFFLVVALLAISGPVFSQECGGLLTSQGSIMSPNYPNQYPNNARCSWKIRTPAGTTVKRLPHILSTEECCDYLQYSYKGIQETFKGLAKVPEIDFGTNVIDVYFYSNSFGSDMGFKASFEVVMAQNMSTTLTDPNGTIEIPPGYLPGLDYEWTIQADNMYDIYISNYTADIRSCCDALKYSYHTMEQTYSGQIYFGPMRFDTNVLKISFTSGPSTDSTGSGFSFQYSLVEPFCWTTAARGSGYFNISPESTGFGAWTHLKRKWCIASSPGSRIVLDFNETKASSDSYCDQDTILISEASGKPLVPVTRSKLPKLLSMNSNQASLVFMSANAQSALDFKVRYNIIECSKKFTDNHGFLTFPAEVNLRSYPSSCSWIVEGSPGSSVEITVYNMTSVSAKGNKLQIREGNDDYHTVHGQPLQDITDFEDAVKLTSFENSVTLNLNLVTSSETNFFAEYRVIPKACGGTYEAPEGFIVIPEKRYDNADKETCQWNVSVPNGYLPKFEFVTYSPINPYRCEEEFDVEISELDQGTKLHPEKCRSGFPSEIIANSSSVTLNVNKTSADKTFALRFQSVCNHTLYVSLTGNMGQSNRYPNIYPFEAGCTWILETDEGQKISVFVPELRLEASKYCPKGGYLTLRDGIDDDSPVLFHATSNRQVMAGSRSSRVRLEICGGVTKFAYVAVPKEKDDYAGYANTDSLAKEWYFNQMKNHPLENEV